MNYSSVFMHPVHGELLNKTESARLLGIRVRKFERIAPPPDYVQQDVYPFWSKRVLDMLPTDEHPSPSEVFEWGRECGRELTMRLIEDELLRVRNEISWVRHYGKVLTHFCGFEIATKDMEPLLAAKWCMTNCSCPRARSVDVLLDFLRSHALTHLPCISREHEVEWYIQGFLSQTKQPPSRT